LLNEASHLHTKIVNKKIARKLELLKEFLDIN